MVVLVPSLLAVVTGGGRAEGSEGSSKSSAQSGRVLVGGSVSVDGGLREGGREGRRVVVA